MLHRRDIVSTLLARRPADLLVVSGLGSSTWDVLSVEDHDADFKFMGVMGQAVPFALGLALAKPDKSILAITGDGELLMQLGILATICTQNPTNLRILVLDNEAYAETGGQATATAAGADIAGVATACGFPFAVCVHEQIEEPGRAFLQAQGPALMVAKVTIEKLPMTIPDSLDGVTAINRFRQAIADI